MTYKPQPPKEPEPKPGVEVGDHLYVHHKGQPCTGLVKSHGRHGVTVEIGGQHHKVKWEHVLGHKKRAPQRYSVIDHGEDGMLVADASGRRRFLATPNESKEDPMVAKSHGQRPIMFFLKATDGAKPMGGKKSGAWKDAGDDPAQAGQHIGFQNGEHKGHGEVVATGKHGVTVKDKAGGEHRIKHEQVTHQWEGDGAPDNSPHEEAEKQDEVLEQYDGKVPLPPELIAELLKQAAPELRAKVAEFLMEKQAGAEIEDRAASLTGDVDAKKD